MFDQEKPSKTRRKKDMQALQDLGARLVALSASQLATIDLPPELREAVDEARRIRSHEGHRRQLQYIGRLMREVDPEPIRDQLARWDGESKEATREMHEIERWRDRLIEDDAALTEFAARHAGCDLQALRASIREARREAALIAAGEQKPRKHYREIYRLVRDAVLGAKPGSADESTSEEAE